MSPTRLAELGRLDPVTLPAVESPGRHGCPVASIGKFIAIGLNYTDHAQESNLAIPTEPIIFSKAISFLSIFVSVCSDAREGWIPVVGEIKRACADARAQNPASADLALQGCLHLFARLVLTNPFTGIDPVEREEIESEIEATALDCLPFIETNPLLMLAAAKLLYFVDRGHLDLAEDHAERAFARMADYRRPAAAWAVAAGPRCRP
ncbi:hypothetical protein QBK99_17865 [Corticibacterium sp. UT-5YL-CI-8]|nr:hypothetical protein [Tianweitania sp. UT-5YL-CI-8]